ncbi:MAG: RNase P subunit p30 family protein [Candidatus Bathyarchaeota archaeon]
MKFVDLHIKPSTTNLDDIECIIQSASQLGYSAIGLKISVGLNESVVDQYKAFAKRHNVDLIKRIDLIPETPRQLLVELNKLRKKYEVISVECRTKTVSRQAAKDHRVDLLNFPLIYPRGLFDRAVAGLAKASNVAFEVNLMEIIKCREESLPKVLSEIQRRIWLAEAHKLRIVLSSGAEKPFDLRAPRDLASFLGLFGLNEQQMKNSISEIPLSIVHRNREKLDPSYVDVGIKTVKGASPNG